MGSKKTIKRRAQYKMAKINKRLKELMIAPPDAPSTTSKAATTTTTTVTATAPPGGNISLPGQGSARTHRTQRYKRRVKAKKRLLNISEANK